MDGLLLVDKPAGISSNDACQRVRRELGLPGGRRGHRIGHAGTLDPFATGLLVVLLGRATRLMQFVVGCDKRYLVGVTFGGISTTDDVCGDIAQIRAPLPDFVTVRDAAAELARMSEQVPPAVSALHVDGERAYKRVRRGEAVDLPARPVTWHSICVADARTGPEGELDRVELDVRCGSGAYMRSLARDLGARLGCGGYASALRRLEVGRWSAADAHAIEDVRPEHLRPARELVPEMPQPSLDPRQAMALAHGQRCRVAERIRPGELVAPLLGEDVVAICVAREDAHGSTELAPTTVLMQPDAVSAAGEVSVR
jgi:tRNA pseudouridine55 synthase